MIRNSRTSRGFTLIELMIVVAVVAILMAIAVPAYQEQVRTTKRSMGKGELLEVRGRQEQFFVNNKQYTNDLTDLGYGAASYAIDVDGNTVSISDAGRIYTIALTNVNANFTTFTVEATPQLGQAKDSRCNKLTLTHLGVKAIDGGTATAAVCW